MSHRPTGAALAAALLAAAGVVWPQPAWADGERQILSWRDDRIAESSGLVVLGDRLVTVNDSGNAAELYVVDRATGETLDVIPWAKEQTDAEALAPGPDDSVWVADIGDNAGERIRLEVTQVPLDGSPTTSFKLAYPGGASNDAETLLVHPRTGRLYVVTKSPLGGRVFAAPARLTPDKSNVMTELGGVRGLITDGSFWPDGDHLLLRGYGRAFLYAFPSLKIRGSFELPSQPQGEGLAIDPDGAIYLSSEGVGTAVWRLRLPPDLVESLDEPAPSEAPGPSESPSASPTLPSDPATASPSEEPAPAEPAADSDANQDAGSSAAWLVLVGCGVLLAAGAAWWLARGRRQP